MRLTVERNAKPTRGKMSGDLVEKASETKNTPTSSLPGAGGDPNPSPTGSPLRQSGNNAARIAAGTPLTRELQDFSLGGGIPVGGARV
jgi:hypothetical protein